MRRRTASVITPKKKKKEKPPVRGLFSAFNRSVIDDWMHGGPDWTAARVASGASAQRVRRKLWESKRWQKKKYSYFETHSQRQTIVFKRSLVKYWFDSFDLWPFLFCLSLWRFPHVSSKNNRWMFLPGVSATEGGRRGGKYMDSSQNIQWAPFHIHVLIRWLGLSDYFMTPPWAFKNRQVDVSANVEGTYTVSSSLRNNGNTVQTYICGLYLFFFFFLYKFQDSHHVLTWSCEQTLERLQNRIFVRYFYFVSWL